MAKIIKLTQEYKEELRKEFDEELASSKLADGKISFNRTLGAVKRKATVYFSEVAWLKMQTLIQEFDKEVAWHGVAFRGDDPEKDEYIIRDILVYPQEVTGATVTSDQAKYQNWLMAHEDDVFNNIRMQGHSHVNMSTTPSPVDTALYESILAQLDDTMFYIFLIYNKRGEKTYKIYDLAKNVLFETADVTVEVLDDDFGMAAFLADAKNKVQNRVYTPVYSSGNYGGYTGTPTTPAARTAPVTTPVTPAAKPATASDTKKNSASIKSGKKSGGRRKGRQKNKSSVAVVSGQTGMFNAADEDYGYDDDYEIGGSYWASDRFQY